MRKYLFTFILLTLSVLAHADIRDRYTLWYDKPAEHWVEALPIGNGRLGAMVYGGLKSDTIQLNEDTFWAGAPYSNNNMKAKGSLKDIRNAINSGNYADAQRLAMRNITADREQTGHGMPYESVGNLVLSFPVDHEEAADYRRELSLDDAVTRTSYTVNGVRYERETFSSFHDNVILMKLKASQKGALKFEMSFCSPLKENRVKCDVARSDYARGEIRVYSHLSNTFTENIPNAVHCVSFIRVVTPDGKCNNVKDRVTVDDATEAYVIISMSTNFRRYDNITGDAENEARRLMKLFVARGAVHNEYPIALSQHKRDYQKQFNRVKFLLGHNPKQEKKPTDVRISEQKEFADPHLFATYFQFGRYLLISSSQPGTQPANLQGIWNPDADQYPAWDSKYTTNINVEMNYWPAEVTNLAECHRPFLKLIQEVSETGQKTAKGMYGARGWTLHHNTDIWRATGAVDYASCSVWPTCNAWFCSHLWERFLFSGDYRYLSETAFPIMADACRFYFDFLTKDPKTQYLVASPSTSPENNPGMEGYYDVLFGKKMKPAIFSGVAMDNQMIYDLLYTTSQAAKLLAASSYGERASYLTAFSDSLDSYRRQLPPIMVGKYGQIQEWLEDWDREYSSHRHVSHLWCAYPGRQVSLFENPEIAAAVKKSLMGRGDASRGWSMGWKVCLWARLLDGNHALRLIQNQLQLKPYTATIKDPDGGTYANMFDAHPPFQIDGNFGCTAGIAEMLVQSHEDAVHILPALPAAWQEGSVSGLRTRGGFEIKSMSWKRGKLVSVTILSTIGGNLRLRSADALTVKGEGRLTVAKGENYNPLMRTYELPRPIIRNRDRLLSLEVPTTFLYDIKTKPGEKYTFVVQ